MSRVDDERDAARLADRIAQQKRAEEQRKADRAAADSNFSRLVSAQKQQAKKTETDQLGRSAIAALLESADAEAHDHAGQLLGKGEVAKHEQKGFRARLGGKAVDEKHSQGARADGERSLKSKLAGDQGRADGSRHRAADAGAAGQKSESRKADARVGQDSLAARAEDSDQASDARGAGGKAGKGALKTDADKGGGGQQQGGKDQKGGSEVPAGFRFNPALAAPVPVALKNQTAGSDRLRRLATEIAQKIVERVRVGTNALGNAEFQIDLRHDVMGGMSVKVSAKNGKISAVFSGSDRDVLKQIEEQAESLKGALSARGLSLESLKVEARA